MSSKIGHPITESDMYLNSNSRFLNSDFVILEVYAVRKGGRSTTDQSFLAVNFFGWSLGVHVFLLRDDLVAEAVKEVEKDLNAVFRFTLDGSLKIRRQAG